jgi:hypothetical protein
MERGKMRVGKLELSVLIQHSVSTVLWIEQRKAYPCYDNLIMLLVDPVMGGR